MDDDYELVPKNLLQELKEENKKLKEQLDRREEHKENTNISAITKSIQEESKKEREIILQNLKEIKEINKSTLNNVVTKTSELDHKLESLVGTLNGLIGSLGDILEEFKDHAGGNNSEIMDQLNKKLEELSMTNNYDSIDVKLKEIESFMNNLKLLLAQIKPSDMRIN